MKLTIEERYSLSHVQHTFIDIYERNKWSSTRHPLVMFSELKNPNNLDISLELERFEASIKEKSYQVRELYGPTTSCGNVQSYP
jgi:hypothetical protein